MENKDLQDLKKLIAFLRSQGWAAEICDTPVPYYDCGVVAGYPETPGEYTGEYLMMPNIPNGDMRYTIPARGNSMIDAGIDDGDTLHVLATNHAQDGDVVIACLNGETTVKVFLLDRNDEPWLVPRNENYLPIKIKDEDSFYIMGKVVSVNKPMQISIKDSRKLFDRIAPKEKAVPREEKVRRAVREIAQTITVNRQWYAVFRVLIDKGYYSGMDDVYTFIGDVKDWLPELEIKLDADDLKKMAVQSFAKPVAFWDASNAPVFGKRFNDYLKIARSLNRAL